MGGISIGVFPHALLNDCEKIVKLCQLPQFHIFPVQALNNICSGSNPDILLTNMCNCRECLNSCNSCIILFPVDSYIKGVCVNYHRIKALNCQGLSFEDLVGEINSLVPAESTLSYLNISIMHLSKVLLKIITRIELNPFISAKKISNELNISYNYLSEKFKKELGISYSQFKVWYRVARIKRLFEEGETNLNEVADKLKYATPSHIYRDLKKTVHKKPKELIRETSGKINLRSKASAATKKA